MFHSIHDLGFSLDQVTPGPGWHCSHLFYGIDRVQMAQLSAAQIATGKQQFVELLAPNRPDRPARLQSGLVAGQKADLALMIMDPDPIKVQSVHHELMASELGRALRPAYSYVSLTEVSEYVQTVEQYSAKLQREGEDPNGSSFQTKLKLYQDRLAKMNVQRLTPEFPEWPVSCFYPMNKWRVPKANWFQLASSERHRLMAEHAHSGIKFAGKVSQLITTGIGLDDWEWGVTLWATNPIYLKQIVYEMRFDEASAKYAEFGSFYTIYRADAVSILNLCRI